jgi:general secretion pathway protein D
VTGVNNSPTISTRKLETKMTLQSGSTVLLGGLISSNNSHGDAGIPVLKDIPVLGGLFGVQKQNKAKTELVVLITPYVMNTDEDAQAVTDSFKSMLPWLGQAETENKDVAGVKESLKNSAVVDDLPSKKVNGIE